MALKKRMTVFEKCQLLRQVIMNRASEVMNYTSWDSEFAAGEMRSIYANMHERYPQLCNLQLSRLTDKQCKELGFGRWSKDNPIRLIPLWLHGFLPKSMKTITSISGKKAYRRKNIDTDNRFGCLAYGIMPADKRNKVKTVKVAKISN